MTLELLRFIKKEAETLWPRILGTSIISGIAHGAVVVVVNAAAQNYSQFHVQYLILFGICLGIYILSFRYAYYATAALMRNAITKAHLRIAEKVRRADLLSFENLGQAHILKTLSEHGEMIFEGSRMIPAMASAGFMLLFIFGYIFFLSQTAFWMALVLILCAVFIYTRNQQGIDRQIVVASQKESEYYTSLNHLLDGFKEIKMNREKGDDLFRNHLGKIALWVKDMRIQIEYKFLSNQLFAQTFWYVLVASVVFLLPKLSSIPNSQIMSLTMVVLFLIGPISIVVTGTPLMVKAGFAIAQLNGLENLLAAADDMGDSHPENPFRERGVFKWIELRDIVFAYAEPADQGSFSIGPVNLRIQAGETLFLVGGNGSGKTTLLKVLTGLYYPQRGTVLMDGLQVNKSNYQHYRNEIAVIFSDFHLFDRLYGLAEKDADPARLRESLQTMGLADKTDYVAGRFTNLNLSTGQKKRLALIVTLMEDRSILVMDELAADLDPEFRKYFYQAILRDLKAKGKTIIAASHDDRYFHVADRVIKMEYGKFIDGE